MDQEEIRLVNSLEHYNEEFGLDLANIKEPVKVYKYGSDSINLELQTDKSGGVMQIIGKGAN